LVPSRESFIVFTPWTNITRALGKEGHALLGKAAKTRLLASAGKGVSFVFWASLAYNIAKPVAGSLVTAIDQHY